MIALHSMHVAVSFLGFLVLFAFYGLVISKIWLVPSHAFALPGFYPKWRKMLGECLALLAIAGIALLFVRTAEMDDGTPLRVLADLPAVLIRSHFGGVWSVHLAMLFVLWAGCAVFADRLPSLAWTVLMLVGTLVLTFTYSASSHASDNGDFTLAEFNDWLHVMSTAVWGGSILVCAVLIFPGLRAQPELLATVATRLSKLAGVALLLVLVTGLYNSSLQVPDIYALASTNYGRVLALKVVIVGAVMAIGALNRIVIASRIEPYARKNAAGHLIERPLALLSRILIADAVLVLLAIIMAAILIQNEAS
jgi:putative copper resistance protein D